MDWATRCDAAAAAVDAWIARVGARWDGPQEATWSDQDLLGHLAAWSDFLLDQIEALLAGQAGAIAAIDVDAWNAEQVGLRRGRPPAETIDEWRRSARRVADVAGGLPADAREREWHVAWSSSPVTIDRLLTLWVVHIEQHRARFGAPPAE
jgi:hypothetical protein